jgi:hypothetical protein
MRSQSGRWDARAGRSGARSGPGALDVVAVGLYLVNGRSILRHTAEIAPIAGHRSQQGPVAGER